ncbi:Tryptophan--tRNA ligase, mitochondrial [Chytriomyces hyalinus]|nr:Tryptophan--tRNA ligase, mitochondrial [Chytriomyces hyalinus]
MCSATPLSFKQPSSVPSAKFGSKSFARTLNEQLFFGFMPRKPNSLLYTKYQQTVSDTAVNIPKTPNPPLPSDPSLHFLCAKMDISSYMPDHADFVAYYAAHSAHKHGISTSDAVIHLQTNLERWHVTKGPFVHDKSKEVFERKTYRRLVQAFNADPASIQAWYKHVNRNLPAGINMTINTFEHHAPSSLSAAIQTLKAECEKEANDIKTRLENTLGPDAAAAQEYKKPLTFEEDVRARAEAFVKQAMGGGAGGAAVQAKKGDGKKEAPKKGDKKEKGKEEAKKAQTTEAPKKEDSKKADAKPKA